MELARSVGRLDWWNVRREHTPYQWLVQRVLYHIHPCGERRADMRAAHNTANLLAAQAKEPLDGSAFSELVSNLRDYLPAFNKSDELEADTDALKVMEAMNG